MNQTELEQLVAELADLEQAAAAEIAELQRACDAALEARRGALRERWQAEMERQAQSQTEQLQALTAALKAEQQQALEQAGDEARVQRRRHEQVRDALVAWLIDRVRRGD